MSEPEVLFDINGLTPKQEHIMELAVKLMAGGVLLWKTSTQLAQELDLKRFRKKKL